MTVNKELVTVNVFEDELYPYFVLDLDDWGHRMQLPREVVRQYKKAERKFEEARKLLNAAVEEWWEQKRAEEDET